VYKAGFGVLADVAQIIYYDHRGMGRSDRSTPDRWNHDQWADDLVALCDALGIVEPVVCGVSFGAIVALHYAVRHPGHAGRLILDSGAAVTDFDERVAMFAQVVPDCGHGVWRDRPDVAFAAIRAFLAG
jgi:proline iminopeptidase